MKKTLLIFLLALLGMSQLGAQEYEYVPFVREGVKWVYCYTNVGDDYRPADPNLAYGIVYLTLEIKGDTIINGESYKAMHKYYGDAINEENDTIPIYLREEGKIVYGIVPDGKTFPDCPIGNRFEGAYFFEKLYDGKEFILYDFNDPEAYWNAEANNEENMDYYEPLSIDIISIGSNLAKRHVGRMGSQDFYQIEGIGVDASGSGYTLFPFRPMATGVDTYFQLSHVIEDGEIIYKSVNYKAPDPDGYEYVPFVREGVKWVYVINRNPFYNIDNDNPAQGDNQFYYTLEIKGDTVINGKTYKAMHKYSGNAINTEADTIPIYLREEDKIVYGIIPDGKFYDGCPVYNLFLESKLIDPYCGEEFVLYDFADPVSYWPEIASPQYTVNITDIEMIQIGSHMAKCYKGDFYGGFSVIEGIGMVCPMNSYTLGFFMPVATGSFGSFYTLSHVIENGEVIYPQNFIDDRYMPLIREDVKWVNERVTVNNGDTTSYYYCYKFKGNHPVKNGYGETFKAMYSYTGESLDMESDGPVAGLRENGALVISYTNQPLNSVIEQDRNLINFYNYQNSNKGHLLYEFAVDAADEMFGIEYYMQYQREPFLTSENLVMLDPIVIDDCICSRCVYLDDDGLPLAYIVEGIGFDSYDMGDLLTPFTRKPDPTADHQEWCGLSHVVKDGQIIYKGLRYRDNVHVGINEVVTDVPQRQLDGNYYNLMGQPVGKDVPTTPGIYIHQGKKILVR